MPDFSSIIAARIKSSTVIWSCWIEDINTVIVHIAKLVIPMCGRFGIPTNYVIPFTSDNCMVVSLGTNGVVSLLKAVGSSRANAIDVVSLLILQLCIVYVSFLVKGPFSCLANNAITFKILKGTSVLCEWDFTN